jgi:2-oxoglutarate dehydrogenase E1 component
MDQLTNPANLRYVEQLYEAYRRDSNSVDGVWQRYFVDLSRELPASRNGDAAVDVGATANTDLRDPAPPIAATVQDQLNEMIRAYRMIGHRAARLDPLGLQHSVEPALDPLAYGLGIERMEQLFPPVGLHWAGPLKLREIVDRLRQSYCNSIGVEYMHIDDREPREWLERTVESDETRLAFSPKDREKILSDLIYATVFDEFIRGQFVGAKSFSLEGAESLIVLLQFAIQKAAADGMREIVVAMAHRGRLNVLVNVIGKKHREVFREFIDAIDPSQEGGGDVKYHLGYSGDRETPAGHKLHLSLCFNPSHLEFVSPVALGRVRAKQDRSGDIRRERGMALLIHGDAAFAGEGITQETLNLSGLGAYRVGGALHVIVNNQIGFTTSPRETRSSRYASDTAKLLQVPILHVNGDDPEAVARAAAIALAFRGRFQRDAVIDLVCYRRHGHNEGDEPAFTHPRLYEAIRRHPPLPELYRKQLIAERVITAEQIQHIEGEYRGLLERELDAARVEKAKDTGQAYGGIWSGYRGGVESDRDKVQTGVAHGELTCLLESQARLPADFHPHPKITRAISLRREMTAGKRPLDWAAAEALAFASLASAGTRVRLTGQDTARGTFSQRHAVLHDIENGAEYVPLQHVAPGQAPVEIYNSLLSEAGVLGFEYGYSLDYPDALVCWEAQFGDFVNAAQVIVDQFIASAEEKWRRLSGLVLLLPHGFEGMGPEHSSARMERFLQLGVRDNLQVVNPTTPAQYFHVLRRQALRRWRKPLVVMTPKSLLRHRDAVSSLGEFAQGQFQTVIADNAAGSAKRVLLCSGKIYYELKGYRAEHRRDDVAIVRVEQLYPTPLDALAEACRGYRDGTPAVWVQEEPANMGAACFWSLQFGDSLFARMPFSVVARPPSASPATGSAARHREQQADLLAAAFGERAQRRETGRATTNDTQSDERFLT